MKRKVTLSLAIGFAIAACTGTAATESTTQETSTTTPSPAATSAEESSPPTSPAEIVFDDQESDGISIVVASVTLPSQGFIAVHGNADGGPGPVIGHSDLLPAGTSTDVVVVLDSPLDGTDLLFPMAHIDMNGNGEYEFAPPDTVVDGPATTTDGAIAVVGGEVTVEGAAENSLDVAVSELGDILVDAAGKTLYLFEPDGQGPSACYDQCANTWPALIGDIAAGVGIDAALVGSTTRTDGSVQTTYNGWPLYYFSGDNAAGDTNGQGINSVWFVVSPFGFAMR